MIIKTLDLEFKLFNDLKQLIVNKNSKTIIKGSFKIKEIGSHVTDIDIQTDVIYNQTLIDILISKIESAKSFIFIQLSLGFKNEYELPWKIDNFGGCEYNPQKVETWFKNFNKMKLVPDNVYTSIETKLFSDKISIKTLIDIENELLPYSELIWRLDDIKRGYIYFLGTKYVLLDMMHIEQPVLEFIYKYENDFCLIDFALNDSRYTYSFTHDMYKYYTEDWYKIMKAFRWFIKPEYRVEYFKIMNGIDFLMAVYNQILLIEKVYKYKLLSRKDFSYIENGIKTSLTKINIKFDDNMKNNIYNTVNTYLKKYVNYFRTKLTDKVLNKFLIQYQRGLDSQIPISRQEINIRFGKNIKCPFFLTDIDEYVKFVSIANIRRLDLDKTIKCFINIMNDTSIPMKQLLEIAESFLRE